MPFALRCEAGRGAVLCGCMPGCPGLFTAVVSTACIGIPWPHAGVDDVHLGRHDSGAAEPVSSGRGKLAVKPRYRIVVLISGQGWETTTLRCPVCERTSENNESWRCLTLRVCGDTLEACQVL